MCTADKTLWLRAAVCWALMVTACCRLSNATSCGNLEELACDVRKDIGSNERPPGTGLCNCHRYYYEKLCCDFKHGTGHLTTADVSPYEEVTLINASYMTYVPSCHRPQTLSVEGITSFYLDTNSSKDFPCHLNVRTFNVKAKNLKAITDAHLVNSDIENVADSKLLGNLYVENSNVKLVYDLTMTAERKNRECFTIKNSNINLLDQLSVMCDAIITNSAIEMIQRVVFQELRLEDTIVSEVQPHAFKFMGGYHRMNNVTFKTLNSEALVFDGDADIVMENVRIENCEAPCIVLNGGSLVGYEIKINGTAVDSLVGSPFVRRDAGSVRLYISGDSHFCQKNFAVYAGRTCDLKPIMTKAIQFIPHIEDSWTTVMNHDNIEIRSHCYDILELNYCKGYIIEVSNVTETLPLTNCGGKEHRLKIVDSELEYIHTKYELDLKAERSKIGAIDVGKVSNLEFTNMEVFTLENMHYQNLSAHDDFRVRNTNFQSIYNLKLSSEALLQDINVYRRIRNLIIDHSKLGTTYVQNATIERVPKRGIIIKKGVLSLEHSFILNLERGGIIVEKDGELNIYNEKSVLSVNCRDSPGIFAFRRSSVIFIHAKTPLWLRNCVKIPKVSYAVADYTITEKDCLINREGHAVCNFAGNPLTKVLGSSNHLDKFTVVHILNTRELLVEPHCFDEVHVRNVLDVTFNPAHSCFYTVKLFNSSVDRMGGYVLQLYANNSTVEYMNVPFALTFASVTNSKLGNISFYVDDGDFDDTVFGEIAKFEILKTVTVSNSKFEVIDSNGVVVHENARLDMVNCSIDKIYKDGFAINGVLTMTNVKIDFAQRSSFLIGHRANLHFFNVTFLEETYPFHFSDGPKIKFENVTIAGTNITFSEQDILCEHLRNFADHGDATKSEDSDPCLAYEIILSILLVLVLIFSLAALYRWLSSRGYGCEGIIQRLCPRKKNPLVEESMMSDLEKRQHDQAGGDGGQSSQEHSGARSTSAGGGSSATPATTPEASGAASTSTETAASRPSDPLAFVQNDDPTLAAGNEPATVESPV